MKRMLLLSLLIAGVVAVAILAGLVVRRGGISHRVKLTTGHELEVVAMIPGDQTFTSEQSWMRAARKVLPASLRGVLPQVTTGRCGSGSNSGSMILQVLTPAGAVAMPLPWSRYAAEDDAGFRYPQEDSSWSFGGGVGGTAQMFGFTLRAFPRRQQDFLVRFYDASQKDLGSVRLRNPFPGPFPEWQADPLPITRTNGPVALTLTSFEIVAQPGWPHLKPEWRLASTDPLWAKAKVGYATTTDATGNEGSLLSPREPVWRVSTLVHRERWEDFRADERVAFAGLAVPAPGAVVSVEQSNQCVGATVSLRTLADAGTIYFTNGVVGALVTQGQSVGWHGSSSDGRISLQYWGSDKPFFLAEVRGVTWDDQVRFRLRDQAGKEIKLDDNYGTDGLNGGGQMHLRKFDYPTNATALSLEVVVSRSLAFEFFVKPIEASPQR